MLLRGSLDDRIRWLWSFYDINKDGKITFDEIQSMITSLYDLMGPNTMPNDEFGKIRHIEIVLQVNLLSFYLLIAFLCFLFNFTDFGFFLLFSSLEIWIEFESRKLIELQRILRAIS